MLDYGHNDSHIPQHSSLEKQRGGKAVMKSSVASTHVCIYIIYRNGLGKYPDTTWSVKLDG